MRKIYLCLFFALCSLHGTAQFAGNSFYLKYGFTEFDLHKDLTVSEMSFVNSPSKGFLLANRLSDGFETQLTIAPANWETNQSGLETITVFNTKPQLGWTMGYRNWGEPGYNAYTRFSKKWNVFTRKQLLVKGGFNYGELDYSVVNGAKSLANTNISMNGWLDVSFRINRFDKLELTNVYVSSHDNGITFNQDPLQGFVVNRSGTLWIPRLTYAHAWSANHTFSADYRMEQFTSSNVELGGKLSSQYHTLKVEDEMRFKRNKVVNLLNVDIVGFEQNESMELGQNYQIVTWGSEFFHELNKDRRNAGLTYAHSLGWHSGDGFIYNPTLIFNIAKNRLSGDVGISQSSRTPSLFSEFQSFRVFNDSTIRSTTKQETYRKAFVSTRYQMGKKGELSGKYVYNMFVDKWGVSPQTKELLPNDIQYSSIFVTYRSANPYGRNHGGHMDLSYQANLGGSSNQLFVPKHATYGSFTYEFKPRKIWKTSGKLSMIANIGYIADYDMPFVVDGELANNNGGLFSDFHLKFKLGHLDYYNRNVPNLDWVNLLVGVNNLFNAGGSDQPVEANLFKPILPRLFHFGVEVKI